ncbi:MAG: hypothetical protein QNJ97_16370 [Myxococcota bacterium]|nr:hypothetical protein [Myxococcota bacterium]
MEWKNMKIPPPLNHWILCAGVLILSSLALSCEPQKEFDYWQPVDWDTPESPDHDHHDIDAGPDSGTMDMKE